MPTWHDRSQRVEVNAIVTNKYHFNHDNRTICNCIPMALGCKHDMYIFPFTMFQSHISEVWADLQLKPILAREIPGYDMKSLVVLLLPWVASPQAVKWLWLPGTCYHYISTFLGIKTDSWAWFGVSPANMEGRSVEYYNVLHIPQSSPESIVQSGLPRPLQDSTCATIRLLVAL